MALNIDGLHEPSIIRQCGFLCVTAATCLGGMAALQRQGHLTQVGECVFLLSCWSPESAGSGSSPRRLKGTP
jgi:hypothetical protein